jgi:hypothetical protein
MDDKGLYRILIEGQPIEFLEQLGREADRVVALGEPQYHFIGSRVRTIHFPVLAQEEHFGTYTINLGPRERINGCSYHGHYPSLSNDVMLAAWLENERFFRMDGLKRVAFPGFKYTSF